jgi:hypothetical protein
MFNININVQCYEVTFTIHEKVQQSSGRTSARQNRDETSDTTGDAIKN